MKISYSGKADILICPLFEDKKPNIKYEKKISEFIVPDFKGKAGEISIVPMNALDLKKYPKHPKQLVFVGLGKKAKLEGPDLRNSFAGILKKLASDKYNKLGIHWDSSLNDYVNEILEGLMLANHHVAKYKTGKDLKKANDKLFTELIVVGKLPSSFKKDVAPIEKVVDAVHYVRDIVTGPPNDVTVDFCANEAKKIAKSPGISVKVYDKAWITKQKMGALLGVNAGSSPKKGAKLVVLEYKPTGKHKKDPILVVGKGLIFDSGGYNLKPTRHIEDMQQDMAGGATILGLFMILKQLNIKRRVIGIIPLTENMIDSDAQRPSDIVTAYNGQTIEVRNTDAEGRLILADALAYGVKTFKPEYTVDLATLTGACVVALGDRYAAIMGNDKKLTEKLIVAGNKTDELLWELPLHKDFTESMKGIIGDIRNADNGTSYMAGSSKAGAFLEYFVGKSKWAHIDIAGTAYVQKPKAHESQYGTGFGVRLLGEFLRNL
ncbi:M17 family metallopeptidase [Patescibacteria group bacterium]